MKYIKLFEEFTSELNEAAPSMVTPIISTLIGSLFGAGVGFLVGGPLGALIGGLAVGVGTGLVSIEVYLTAKEDYNNALDMILFEYGKDTLSVAKINALIDKYRQSSDRVKKIKQKLVSMKRKSANTELSDIKQDSKFKKTMGKLIKLEASDLAHNKAFNNYNTRIWDLKRLYSEEVLDSVMPNLWNLSKVLKSDMEELESVVNVKPNALNYNSMYLNSEDEIKLKDLYNKDIFLAERKAIAKEYKNILKIYEKEYAKFNEDYADKLIKKYKSGIVMKESVEYLSFDLLNESIVY